MRCVNRNGPLIWILHHCRIVSVLQSNIKIINVNIISYIRINTTYSSEDRLNLSEKWEKGLFVFCADCLAEVHL